MRMSRKMRGKNTMAKGKIYIRKRKSLFSRTESYLICGTDPLGRKVLIRATSKPMALYIKAKVLRGEPIDLATFKLFD